MQPSIWVDREAPAPRPQAAHPRPPRGWVPPGGQPLALNFCGAGGRIGVGWPPSLGLLKATTRVSEAPPPALTAGPIKNEACRARPRGERYHGWSAQSAGSGVGAPAPLHRMDPCGTGRQPTRVLPSFLHPCSRSGQEGRAGGSRSAGTQFGGLGGASQQSVGRGESCQSQLGEGSSGVDPGGSTAGLRGHSLGI